MVEILIAISIITVLVLAVMGVAQKSVSISRQSFHTAQAGFLLEEGAEATRIFRDNAWANISSLSINTNYYPTFGSGTWILSATPNTVGIFTRSVSVANVNRDATTSDISNIGVNDPDTKLITITASWNEGGSIVNKTLPFYITNIFE